MHPLTDTEVYQETHYYPFGMTMEGEWQDIVNGPENNYLYNGKELNSDFGLDWSDYGARYYDAAIGRWGQVDPMAEVTTGYSPYVYTMNNPIYFNDPTGMIAEPPENGTAGQEWNDDSGDYYHDGNDWLRTNVTLDDVQVVSAKETVTSGIFSGEAGPFAGSISSYSIGSNSYSWDAGSNVDVQSFDGQMTFDPLSLEVSVVVGKTTFNGLVENSYQKTLETSFQKNVSLGIPLFGILGAKYTGVEGSSQGGTSYDGNHIGVSAGISKLPKFIGDDFNGFPFVVSGSSSNLNIGTRVIRRPALKTSGDSLRFANRGYEKYGHKFLGNFMMQNGCDTTNCHGNGN